MPNRQAQQLCDILTLQVCPQQAQQPCVFLTLQVRPQQAQQLRGTASETRAMASIRPMAVATQPAATTTTSSTAAPSQTPTATVHPTTQQEAEPHAATSRPTLPVQALSPHVEEQQLSVTLPDGASQHVA